MKPPQGAIWWGAAAVAVGQVAPAAAAWPALRKHFWPSLAGLGSPNSIALTFDDGPDPRSTPYFLELLKEREIRATFFLLGSMAVRARTLTRTIAEAGHEIGVHGYYHRCLLQRGYRSTMDDLRRARDAIAEAAGVTPRWFRPPYGVLTATALLAARQLHLQPVLWSAWGRDWGRRATPTSIARTVRAGLDGGGTILLHDSDCTSAPDSWRRTLAALPSILDYCTVRGWSVGPLRDHALAR